MKRPKKIVPEVMLLLVSAFLSLMLFSMLHRHNQAPRTMTTEDWLSDGIFIRGLR